jgi:hypothetical protein
MTGHPATYPSGRVEPICSQPTRERVSDSMPVFIAHMPVHDYPFAERFPRVLRGEITVG